MNPFNKVTFTISIALALVISMSNTSSSSIVKLSETSYSVLDSSVREVMTSQQLFIVEVKPSKTESKKADLKAELRDAYKILCYDKDSVVTELNWTMAVGQMPKAGLYYRGTSEYKQLDSLIKQSTKKPR